MSEVKKREEEQDEELETMESDIVSQTIYLQQIGFFKDKKLMTCFVGAVNILCIVFQVAFCNYLYVGGMVDNYGYYFGESPPEVKAIIKEK